MSTPASAYESPRPLASLSPLTGAGRGGGDSGSNDFEGHLVHLELLRHRDRVGAIEARTAELVRSAPPDGPHQTGDREVGEGVGPDDLPDLLHRATRRQQLLGRPD